MNREQSVPELYCETPHKGNDDVILDKRNGEAVPA